MSAPFCGPGCRVCILARMHLRLPTLKHACFQAATWWRERREAPKKCANVNVLLILRGCVAYTLNLNPDV